MFGSMKDRSTAPTMMWMPMTMSSSGCDQPPRLGVYWNTSQMAIKPVARDNPEWSNCTKKFARYWSSFIAAMRQWVPSSRIALMNPPPNTA